jgi:hypothetical protein
MSEAPKTFTAKSFTFCDTPEGLKLSLVLEELGHFWINISAHQGALAISQLGPYAAKVLTEVAKSQIPGRKSRPVELPADSEAS